MNMVFSLFWRTLSFFVTTALRVHPATVIESSVQGRSCVDSKILQVLRLEHERWLAAIELYSVAARGCVERLHHAHDSVYLGLGFEPLQLHAGAEEWIGRSQRCKLPL